MAERADEYARRESRQAKTHPLATGFDVPGSIDNAVFRRSRPPPVGSAAAEWDGDHTSTIRREPIGVVGHRPVELPLQMAMWKMLPAIAAGNTMCLPSEMTPITSLMLAEMTAPLAAGRGFQRSPGPVRRRRSADRPPSVRGWCRPPDPPESAIGGRDGRPAQTSPPGAGGQGAVRRLGGRRSGCRHPGRSPASPDQHRPGLHRRHPAYVHRSRSPFVDGVARVMDASCGDLGDTGREPTWVR